MNHNQMVEKEPVRPAVYGLGFYFFLAGADSFRIGSFGSVLKIPVMIPLALALLDLKKMRIRFSPTLIFQLLFWLLTCMSLFYSVNADKTFSSVQTLTLNLMLVFGLGMLEQYNQRELKFMQNAMLAGGWTTIALILLFSDVSEAGRLTLLLGDYIQDQNYINGYFLYTFSWHSYQMLLNKRKMHIIPVVFIISIVLLTGSRGALLAFVVVLLVHMCIFLMHTKHKIRNFILLVLLVVLLIAIFELILSKMPENIAQRFSLEYIMETGTIGRAEIWGGLLRTFIESSFPRMLFGHGYGATRFVDPEYGRVAHNLYIDNLTSVGVVGLILQLLIQGSVLRVLCKCRQHTLLGAYFGMLCMCMSLSLVSYKPIWNIMLVSLALDFYDKSKHYSSTLSTSATQEVSQ